MKTKRINYAYPTSDIAKSKGYFHSGCWYLAICDEEITKDDIIYCSLEIDDVILTAETNLYNFEWHHYSHYKGA